MEFGLGQTPAARATLRWVEDFLHRVRIRLVGSQALTDPVGFLIRTHRWQHRDGDSHALRRAYEVAERHHRGQMRKSGEEYITHPLAVAQILAELGMDTTTLVAALLHDTVEDSEDGAVMHMAIQEAFGPRVAAIVLACSDAVAVPGRPKPDWRERKDAYLQHLEDADEDVLLVSACDKVHNAGSILADLRTDGEDLWSRFTVTDPHQQLWYYTRVTEILRRRLPGSLTDQLGELVKEISALVG